MHFETGKAPVPKCRGQKADDVIPDAMIIITKGRPNTVGQCLNIELRTGCNVFKMLDRAIKYVVDIAATIILTYMYKRRKFEELP